jgi:hypothetical protein
MEVIMAGNNEPVETLPEQTLQVKPQTLQWLGGIWFRPKATLQKILSFEKGIWFIPLLILTGVQIVKSLVESPFRIAAAQAVLDKQMMDQAAQMGDFAGKGGGVMGGDPTATTANFSTGPIANILLPALLGIITIWVVWILFGSMLHLSLTLAGNRSNATTSLNLMAWASLPIAVRFLVQIVGTLISGQVIASPGLSGFVDASTGGGAAFAAGLLGCIDIYFIWQMALLVIGGMVMGNISRTKAIFSVVICAVVVLSLQAIPTTVSHMLSGLSTGSTMYF